MPSKTRCHRPRRPWNTLRWNSELEQRPSSRQRRPASRPVRRGPLERSPAYSIDRDGKRRDLGLSCQLGEPGDDPPDEKETCKESGAEESNRFQASACNALSGQAKTDWTEPDLARPAIVATPDLTSQSAERTFESAFSMRPVYARRPAVRAMSLLWSDQNDPSSRKLRSSIRPSARVVPGSRRENSRRCRMP
jgi:hypothetical protein